MDSNITWIDGMSGKSDRFDAEGDEVVVTDGVVAYEAQRRAKAYPYHRDDAAMIGAPEMWWSGMSRPFAAW